MPPALRPKTATLHDVARQAGVSLMTVSRAISQPERVARDTLDKVMQAVQATGYVPNRLAGGLKSRRSYTVAALVPAISVPQFLPTIQTLTETLEQAGYQLILGQTGYDRAHEIALLRTMLSRRVDGIVAIGLLQPGGAAQQLVQHGIPVVETWDMTERPLDAVVGFSHIKAGSAVAGYFLSKGWQRVGMATAGDPRAALRHEGFAATLGRDVPTAIATGQPPAGVAQGREALSALLRQDPQLRAVFCSSDGMAQGVLTEAQARGLRVPEDLAVLGFGGAEFAAHLHPSLSTVQIDGPAIGRRAAEFIIARCQGQAVEPRVIDLGFQIVERASTQA